jgi:hypothetical protein
MAKKQYKLDFKEQELRCRRGWTAHHFNANVCITPWGSEDC